jgi:hypothetical protein
MCTQLWLLYETTTHPGIDSIETESILCGCSRGDTDGTYLNIVVLV